MQNSELIRGENNALEYSAAGVGNERVALFFALVRGISDERITELMTACAGDQASSDLAAIVADLFVMSMQTRDCRGGKGERALTYKMLLHLFKTYPNTALQMLTLFSEYGYYKDFFQLYELVGESPAFQVIRNRITDIVANQLIEDEAILEGRSSSGKKVSLCAKYCPREGKHFDTGKKSSFSELVNKLYPATSAHKTNKKQYRQLITKLTKVLDVPEVKMCGKRFSELEFSKVPSVCTKKFCKAFLNEKTKAVPTPGEDETGNRFPTDEDRIMCRQNLRQAAVDQKVKGKQVFPHEIVETLFNGRTGISTLQKEVFHAQWKDLREHLLAQLAAAQQDPTKASSVNVGKLVPLSDVSGSMGGTPMVVSIALGILISEVNHPAFRDRVLTCLRERLRPLVGQARQYVGLPRGQAPCHQRTARAPSQAQRVHVPPQAHRRRQEQRPRGQRCVLTATESAGHRPHRSLVPFGRQRRQLYLRHVAVRAWVRACQSRKRELHQQRGAQHPDARPRLGRRGDAEQAGPRAV
jgi:hypothetical protein